MTEVTWYLPSDCCPHEAPRDEESDAYADWIVDHPFGEDENGDEVQICSLTPLERP